MKLLLHSRETTILERMQQGRHISHTAMRIATCFASNHLSIQLHFSIS